MSFCILTQLKLLVQGYLELCPVRQVSLKKEVGVMVNDLVFWLTVCLILKMCY